MRISLPSPDRHEDILSYLSACFLIFTGANAGPPFERPGEITLIGEAYHEGDLCLRVVALFEVAGRERLPRRLQNVSVAGALRAKLAL